MRQSSTLPSPNYKDYKDHDLRKHGSPDLVLLVQGHKLYVHAEKLTVYSPVLYNKLQKLDPIWGKMVQLQGRTVAGVTALLDAIYPPQRMPEAIHFDEVYALSKELKMELLIQKLKLGIIKNCSLCPLLVAQEHEKSPDVVFDAFAEFTLNDLKLLDEFDKLSAETRFEIARRRAEVLERQLRHDIMEKVYTQAKARLFRICPTPKLDSDTDGINRFTSAVHLRWSLHSMSQQRLEQLNATKRTSEFRRREVYGRRRSTCAEIFANSRMSVSAGAETEDARKMGVSAGAETEDARRMSLTAGAETEDARKMGVSAGAEAEDARRMNVSAGAAAQNALT